AGSANVINCTFSGNLATARDAESGGPGTAGSPGVAIGGAIISAGGTIWIQNSIVAANTLTAGNPNGTASGPDVSGIFVSGGHNLVGDGTGSTGFNGPGDQVGTNLVAINPLLGPLQNNGGPTQTMRPRF